MVERISYAPPTDEEIDIAQSKLGFVFPIEYCEFIKNGYDLGDSVYDALEIDSNEPYLDIYQILADARKYFNLPLNLMPICADNSNYFCFNENMEVLYWSHDGGENEKWENFSLWLAAIKEEAAR